MDRRPTQNGLFVTFLKEFIHRFHVRTMFVMQAVDTVASMRKSFLRIKWNKLKRSSEIHKNHSAIFNERTVM